jgi:hypothetical protein
MAQGGSLVSGTTLLTISSQASLLGSASLLTAPTILHLVTSGTSVGGSNAASAHEVVWNARTAALVGEAIVPSALPLATFFATAAPLHGDTSIPDLPFLLWNDTTGQIIASGGYVSYIDTNDGALVKVLRVSPLRGGSVAVVLVNSDDQIIGGSLFTLIDTSHTTSDRGNFSQTARVA